jgi:site-specific recombinase XerD
MLDELFERFNGAFSENTLRAYRSDMTNLIEWCGTQQLNYKKLTGQNLADYAESMAENVATATIRRRLASISSVFNLAQFENNTKHPDLLLALKRIHRRKGRAQKQAPPLTKEVKAKLIAVCPKDTRGLRDRVLLELGYETMRRRSELCSFKFSDRVESPDGRIGLRLNFSKTDQFGRGKIIKISNQLSSLIDEWGEVVGNEGYILRGITVGLTFTSQLCPHSINLILKKLQQDAELDINPTLSGHSFRVGRALDLLNEGESLPKIMLRGGWSSESTVMRYLRSWEF